jgi:Tfp pilus assembly protein PilV
MMISMVILTVGLLGAMRVFPVGLRASQRSELRSRAAILARRSIESLKLKPWDQLMPGESSAQEEGFTVTTRISQPSVEPLVDPTRLKAIEVTVRMTEEGAPKDLQFVTYVRRDAS